MAVKPKQLSQKVGRQACPDPPAADEELATSGKENFRPLTMPQGTHRELSHRWMNHLLSSQGRVSSKLQGAVRSEVPSHVSLMDLVSEFIVGRLFQPGSELSTTVRYLFELTGAAPGTHDILVEHGEASMEPAGTSAAQVTFRYDTETFALLAYGRVTLNQAVSDRLIAVEGDRELAANF